MKVVVDRKCVACEFTANSSEASCPECGAFFRPVVQLRCMSEKARDTDYMKQHWRGLGL